MKKIPKKFIDQPVQHADIMDVLKKLPDWEFKRSEYHVVNGLGSDPTDQWEGEPSFFVMGISLPEAKIFGRKYRQNAIVWCDASCIPVLITLR